MNIPEKLYERVNENTIGYAKLDITSFTYCKSLNAEHYYGELSFMHCNPNRYKVLYNLKLTHEITLEEAEYLDRKETACGSRVRTWKKGMNTTSKFNSEEDVIIAAFNACKQVSDEINFGFNMHVPI